MLPEQSICNFKSNRLVFHRYQILFFYFPGTETVLLLQSYEVPSTKLDLINIFLFH